MIVSLAHFRKDWASEGLISLSFSTVTRQGRTHA